MKVLRVAAIAVLAVAALLFFGVGFGLGWPVIFGPAARPVTDRTFESTPERLARGDYLVNAVCSCMKCHSPADTALHGAPPAEGRIGSGAEMLGPGVLIAPNITPDRETGIGSWTDDEIARAIREGVSRDGRTLFPMMPYAKYRTMTDEDVASIVVYLRSIEPVESSLPETEIIFPVKHLINTYPQPVTEPVMARFATPLERGSYLVNIAACSECHSTFDAQRNPIEGLDFAGGNTMEEHGMPPATVPNITPDPSGLGSYTPERFREVMRTGRDGTRVLHAMMPYAVYANLTDEDLDAMFAFLQTVKPVKHWVNGTSQPVLCAICNNQHGMGELNTAE